MKFCLKKIALAWATLLPPKVVLATTHTCSTSGDLFCKHCHTPSHQFAHCLYVDCKYCHGYGHILENCPTQPPRPKGASKFKSSSEHGSSFNATIVSDESASPTFSMSDLEVLLKQVISSSSSSSSVLSVTPGTFWLLDPRCYNHMTS